MTHSALVERAERWLRSKGRHAVATELSTISNEIPDAIGFAPTKHSVLVECKASRADFLADAKKPFRRREYSGLGRKRYYMCPPNMIRPGELPDNWGLLYCYPTIVRIVVKSGFFTHPDIAAREVVFLSSMLARVELGFPGGFSRLAKSYSATFNGKAEDRITE